jgi:hypothetical protein
VASSTSTTGRPDHNPDSAVHGQGQRFGTAQVYENLQTEVGSLPGYRWGDYNSAVVDGSNIWFATEYIGTNDSCTPTQWANDFANNIHTFAPVALTCGGTRTISYNWDMRLTKINMGS